MDGRFIRLQDGKAWRCENGHLLGVMRRERIGKGRGYRLYLLHTAIVDAGEDVPLRWKSKVEGTCRDIECEVCKTEKTWWAGQAALEGLVGKELPDPEECRYLSQNGDLCDSSALKS